MRDGNHGIPGSHCIEHSTRHASIRIPLFAGTTHHRINKELYANNGGTPTPKQDPCVGIAAKCSYTQTRLDLQDLDRVSRFGQPGINQIRSPLEA